MGNVQIVTGYVPIENHPRSAAEYGKLGERIFAPLAAAGVPIQRFLQKVEETWLYEVLERAQTEHPELEFEVAVADNPAKNTLAYHCVQHQKFAWLNVAAAAAPHIDTFVWLDYGIGHVPGVKPHVISDLLDKVRENPHDFAIPGCWQEPFILTDAMPCWRFCGGLMIVPRDSVKPLLKAVTQVVGQRLDERRSVTWEVNTLAEAEKQGLIKPRWYLADHNATMFTGYDDEQGQGC